MNRIKGALLALSLILLGVSSTYAVNITAVRSNSTKGEKVILSVSANTFPVQIYVSGPSLPPTYIRPSPTGFPNYYIYSNKLIANNVSIGTNSAEYYLPFNYADGDYTFTALDYSNITNSHSTSQITLYFTGISTTAPGVLESDDEANNIGQCDGVPVLLWAPKELTNRKTSNLFDWYLTTGGGDIKLPSSTSSLIWEISKKNEDGPYFVKVQGCNAGTNKIQVYHKPRFSKPTVGYGTTCATSPKTADFYWNLNSSSIPYVWSGPGFAVGGEHKLQIRLDLDIIYLLRRLYSQEHQFILFTESPLTI